MSDKSDDKKPKNKGGRPRMNGEVKKPTKIARPRLKDAKTTEQIKDVKKDLVEKDVKFTDVEMEQRNNRNLGLKIQTILNVFENTAQYILANESDLQVLEIKETMDSEGNYKMTRLWGKKSMTSIADAIDVTEEEIDDLLSGKEGK